jgi:putative endonuclease
MPGRYYVYILASKRNGTLYVGVSTNLSSRIAAHKAGVVPGFTKQYGVHMLVHVEEYASVMEARAREHALKRWRRVWKLELIEKDNPSWKDLSGEL